MWWVQNVMQIGQWFMAYYDFVKKKKPAVISFLTKALWTHYGSGE